VQVDVIKQLGAKIEDQLQVQSANSWSESREDKARSRATQIKLTRDFRRVEMTFKNLQLDIKRKKSIKDARLREEEDRREREEKNHGMDRIKLQMQLNENRINEEIMREREEEIRNINKGMHQVNEIYKVS